MAYLNVEEIESALVLAAESHPSVCELIDLPHATHEGRTCHAVRIRGGTLNPRPGVLLIGGVHAREWGGSDILIHFVNSLLYAYENNTDLVFGAKTFTATRVRRIIENLELFVFPDVNPDGKNYSQTQDRMWRKNRGPTESPDELGTDINRNYDFLWDFRTYFHPDAPPVISDLPFSNLYKGQGIFSEPETQNVKHMLDTFTHIRYFADIHSYGQLIIYPWGNDDNQCTNWDQNFMNTDYDGLRGIFGDQLYGEHIFYHDEKHTKFIAERMKAAIFQVRGKSYTLATNCNYTWGTAATSKQYVFSRHLSNPSDRIIFSYTIEFGEQNNDAEQAFGFQPHYSEMENIILDVSAALTELCDAAADADFYIRDTMDDIGERMPMLSTESPDVVISQYPITSPENPLYELKDPNNLIESKSVAICQDNWIYIRVGNRGGSKGRFGAEVYCCSPNERGNPGNWQYIGAITSTSSFSEVAPNEFQSNAKRWLKDSLPEPGNYYIIVFVGGEDYDHLPDKEMIQSDTDFENSVKSCNNIACKMVTVVKPKCVAPVFKPSGLWPCYLISIICTLVILALAIPAIFCESVRCTIKQLAFRIKHCTKGNKDPHIRL